MSILTPLALVLALLLPLIIAMYLLKLRRTEQIISSTYLWRQIVRDLEANAPWQRLRRNLLLILQLLFLIILIFAIARPYTWIEGVSGQALILILDTSASMATTDVLPSRIEAAKDQAQRIVEGLPEIARVTVIEAGRKAKVVIASSNDFNQVRQAIEAARVGTGGSDMGVALQLASAIAMRQPDTQTVVLSDGNVTMPERISISGTVHYVAIGNSDQNQGMGLLNLQPMPGSDEITAFAQVINYSDSNAERRLALYTDGQLVNVYDLDFTPRGEQVIIMQNLPPTTHLVEARLLSDEKTYDYLLIDDRAFAVHRQTSPISVTLVTEGNLFLETALALMPNLVITSMKPSEAMDLPSAALTVLDRFVPLTTTLPLGNLLFIAPLQGNGFFTTSGLINNPVPQPAESFDETQPLIAYVNLEEVNILDAVRIPLPPWAQPVIVGDDPAQGAGATSPLLFTGETDGRRIAVLAFDLHRSDLPLQVAFPILLANLVQWLAPGQGGSIPVQINPGEAITFAIPPGTALSDQSRLRITRPDGTSMNVEVDSSPVVFADTEQLGLYRIYMGEKEPMLGQPIDFVVNLISPQESLIQPAHSLPSLESTTLDEVTNTQRARREWWRVSAAFALALLLLEWLVYNRSILVMFYKRFTQPLRGLFSQ